MKHRRMPRVQRRRLAQHEFGLAAVYTRTRLPVRLLHIEDFARIEDAFQRENQVQGWGRPKWLALVKGKVDQLDDLGQKWRRSAPDESAIE